MPAPRARFGSRRSPIHERPPAGDSRRRTLLTVTRDTLIDLRRYQDAAEARSYGGISSLFEMLTQERPIPPSTSEPEKVRAEVRAAIANIVVKDIEVLVGSGDVTHAREFAQRLLAYDNSEATRALNQRHAERAGQPDLLATAPYR